MSHTQLKPQRLLPARAFVIGTATVALTDGPCHGVHLKAICPGQTIFIGGSSALLPATGYPLSDGQELHLSVNNISQIWVCATAATQSLRVLPFVFD